MINVIRLPSGKCQFKKESNAIAHSCEILSTCRRLPYAGGALTRSHLRGDALLQSALGRAKPAPAGRTSMTPVEASGSTPGAVRVLSPHFNRTSKKCAVQCGVLSALQSHSNCTSEHLKCGESAVSALHTEINERRIRSLPKIARRSKMKE